MAYNKEYYDVSCPYCGKHQDICHDDGYGYCEDGLYHQECDCGKIFIYTTSISYSYDVNKSPCMNGGEHDLEKVVSYPNFYPDHVRCKNCDYENKGEFSEESFFKCFEE